MTLIKKFNMLAIAVALSLSGGWAATAIDVNNPADHKELPKPMDISELYAIFTDENTTPWAKIDTLFHDSIALWDVDKMTQKAGLKNTLVKNNNSFFLSLCKIRAEDALQDSNGIDEILNETAVFLLSKIKNVKQRIGTKNAICRMCTEARLRFYGISGIQVDLTPENIMEAIALADQRHADGVINSCTGCSYDATDLKANNNAALFYNTVCDKGNVKGAIASQIAGKTAEQPFKRTCELFAAKFHDAETAPYVAP